MSEKLCHINIYCDESRHTSNGEDPYMVIGAIACPREQKAEIYHAINLLRKKHDTWKEFGWKTLSPSRKDFYWELLELFRIRKDLSFRCLVVDRNILDHEQYSEGDAELGFYKLYYQMLVHWLQPECAYHLYLDWQQNREQGRFKDLGHVLGKKLSGRAKIECLEPVGSKEQPLVQLCDLFIGAVGYAWNDRAGSETKVEFCNALAAGVGLSSLKVGTYKNAPKFNVFHFTGR
ncbi:DUF3800 domain-containing protein [Geopsychrobacter electrodiphilus]|uniref:DUF3800 domain-containing protein n=1 Tax=Geopsychrobacter electrodiphilus TaxID=225196 RepID=UPI0003701C35|nr:DUF3800 domain-containing protein [Geopsychrobacter electrodiphilus]